MGSRLVKAQTELNRAKFRNYAVSSWSRSECFAFRLPKPSHRLNSLISFSETNLHYQRLFSLHYGPALPSGPQICLNQTKRGKYN